MNSLTMNLLSVLINWEGWMLRSVQILNHSHCAVWLSAGWSHTETFLFLDLWSQDILGLRCVYKLMPKQYNKLFKSYLCCYSISSNPVSVSVNPLLGSELESCGCWLQLMYLLDVKHIGLTAVSTLQILQLTPSHREQISTAMRDEHQRPLKNVSLVSCPDLNLVSEYMLARGADGGLLRIGHALQISLEAPGHGSAAHWRTRDDPS